jgi:hypothetical protein
MYPVTRGARQTIDAAARLVSDILGGVDHLGYQGVLETISFFVLPGMIIGAFALAGLLLVHTL